jgi:1-acyl-sn-glycerol-3-phosphate acyltransferase
MKLRKYRAGKLFNKFLKLTLGGYMKLLFGYKIENGELAGLKPPYIVLANHTNFWDPFLLSMCFPDPVYFITSDAYFRSPVLKQLLKLVGAIPKTKNVADPQSIRGILEVVKSGGIVGIFPEGRRNWDGRTLPLLYATAKLIKALKIPVVSVVFQGACLSMPRWAASTRKGGLTMTLSRVLESQDIAGLTADEIYRAISESLAHDETDYQRSRMIPYKGRRPAEKLELFLFTCPECGAMGGLESDGSHLRCGNCSYDVVYNSYGFLETDGTKLHFDNARDWNLWQSEQLEALTAARISSERGEPLLADREIVLRTGQKTGSLKTAAEVGTLTLYPGRIEYGLAGNVLHRFHLHDIFGENIQFNNQLEIIEDSILYRFSRKNGNFSAYKWVMAIGFLKKHQGGKRT